MLRRVSQINLCIQDLLVYIEKQNGSQWILNTELVRDTVPFTKYMQSFEKCHAVIVDSIQYFIKQLDAENNPRKESSKVVKIKRVERDEDIMRKLEMILASQWTEFENMLFEYIETKNSSRVSQIISTKGALTMQALRFAVNNLLASLSKFAECKISY